MSQEKPGADKRAQEKAGPEKSGPEKPDKPDKSAKARARREPMGSSRMAKFRIGDVVKHRIHPFRGIVFDIDPVFNNTEEWWQSIPPEVRPRKDQPFYHLLAENAQTEYIAYVSEQNLLADTSNQPLRHPQVTELFKKSDNGSYKATFLNTH